MVAHMAMSYRNGNQELSSQAKNADHSITDNEKSCDVDMECTVPAGTDSQQQTHIPDDPWYTVFTLTLKITLLLSGGNLLFSAAESLIMA